MSDFIAAADRDILASHGLDSFEALWDLRLEAVDHPNSGRGGWSTVFRLELEEAVYYLKRQSNFLCHGLMHPFGEPTFAREFRSIRRYARLGIATLQVAFFGQRRVDGECRAILVSRSLDGWRDLSGWLADWPALLVERREAVIRAVGELARRLHQAGQCHGCFYPKHLFLRESGNGFEACLIDLEKTRALLLGRRDRVKDLETLVRRAGAWGETEVRALLSAYLARTTDSPAVDRWLERIRRRRDSKEHGR